MAPDELYDAYDMADLLKGKIPHWHRAKGDSEAFEDDLERAGQDDESD